MSPQRRTALVSVIAAAVLIATKLSVGLHAGSLGLLSDAAHSGSDLVAALLTFFVLGVAIKPADRSHPWGHGKAEHLAALAEAAVLIGASIFIAIEAISRLSASEHPEVDATWFVFALLGGVMLIDASRASISFRASRTYASPALAASALHFASDFVGSGAVLVGLIAVRAGAPGGDSIAALLVAGLVLLAATRLVRQNVDALMDRAPASAEAAARAAIDGLTTPGHLRRLRVREAGGRHFADVTVGVAPGSSVAHSHNFADEVEKAVQAVLPGADVVVHVEPDVQGLDLHERVVGAALGVESVEGVHNVSILNVEGAIEISLHIRMPGEMTLEAAHAAASAVEASVRTEVRQASSVRTHLEPQQPPIAGSSATLDARSADLEAVELAVTSVVGAAPYQARVVTTDAGLVVFVTLTLGASTSLAAAHERATDVEAEVRRSVGNVSEVVVHTEP
ncbi:MAG: cation diffusion facilitator family transporter [Gaiellaceae bacterium]